MPPTDGERENAFQLGMFGGQEDLQTIVMTSADKEQFRCTLPKVSFIFERMIIYFRPCRTKVTRKTTVKHMMVRQCWDCWRRFSPNRAVHTGAFPSVIHKCVHITLYSQT